MSSCLAILERDPGVLRESTVRRVENSVRKLVDYMVFVDEAKLGTRITGTSQYREVFESMGPEDTKGRSLRDERYAHLDSAKRKTIRVILVDTKSNVPDYWRNQN